MDSGQISPVVEPLGCQVPVIKAAESLEEEPDRCAEAAPLLRQTQQQQPCEHLRVKCQTLERLLLSLS